MVPTFEICIEKFIIIGFISNVEQGYSQVKDELLERFSKKLEPQDIIREATNAVPDESNCILSLNRLHALYGRRGFNEEAKFRFL